MFDSIFLIILGIPVGLFLLVVVIGMVRDMFPERKSVLEKRIDQLEKELAKAKETLAQKDQECKDAVKREKEQVEERIKKLEALNIGLSQEYSQIEESLYSYEYENEDLIEKNRSLSNENLALTKIIKALKERNEDILQENADWKAEITHYINNHAPASLFPYQIDLALYQNGINSGSLKSALSENIIDRFVDVSKTMEINSIYDKIEIAPDKKSGRRDNYLTSLASCTCDDFGLNTPPHACKHMFTLAMQLGILTVAGEPLTPPRKTK